ncbi:unnamed protein product [Brassica oleracea var. botrytis]
MSSTAKRTSSSKENPLGDVRNPLGAITNQKSGSPLSTLVNFFSSFRQRKLGLGFSVICKFLQKKLLKLHHCSKKTNQSKPPNTIAKSNLLEDPQLCGAFACEAKKRPAIDYMERVQPNINSTMHAILIDWLVEVAEAFSLSPETLYLAVNCLDRYLSGNVITELNLQLLGVSCIMISAKYYGRGSVRAPPRQVESFCYITDYSYSRNELLEMESCVLNYLKFELTTPTENCFLSRFVPQGKREEEVLSHLLFESLASYLCELSLLDYAMLRYAPSLVAASAVFFGTIRVTSFEKTIVELYVGALHTVQG